MTLASLVIIRLGFERGAALDTDLCSSGHTTPAIVAGGRHLALDADDGAVSGLLRILGLDP